jgi:hypothetical protein
MNPHVPAWFSCSLAFLLLVVPTASRAQADDSQPYLYQRGGHGTPGALAVELETAYGTRDARPFGAEGVEQGARLRWAPLAFLNLEGWSGVLVTGGTHRATAGAIDLHLGVLNQADHQLNLTLGAGYLFDYRQAHVPRLRATLGRSWGALDTSLSGYLEIPTARGRDAVDLALALAASYRLARWVRLGLEAEGQDLEGFWEPGEAEGGAKLVLGPTAWFKLWDRLYAKLNLGAILPATANAPAGLAVADSSLHDYGVLGRAVVGWSFD